MTNKDTIVMHLETHLQETGQEAKWNYLLSYCLGYYGEITQDHIQAVMEIVR